MPLMMKTQRDGSFRPFWYGVYIDSDGKRKVVNLNVDIRGTPPDSGSLRHPGDGAFEKSRQMAIAALNVYQEEARRKGRAEHLTERLIEAKTGRAVEYVELGEMEARWRSMGRETPAGEAYLKSCDATFRRFREFVLERQPGARFLYEVSKEDAEAYLAVLQEGYARKTVRDHVKLLNKSFEKFLPVGAANPFAGLVGRRSAAEASMVHRKPFSAEELGVLLESAKGDDFLYPLVVTAACTGLRRGDVCRLRWESVDLDEGVLMVKTSKTGASVEVPIFPPLREVLEKQDRDGDLVFPEAAEMAEKNPDGLTWRFKKLVAETFGEDKAELPENHCEASGLLKEGLAAIAAGVSTEKRRDRMLEVFRRYAGGKSVRAIVAETGIPKATVSTDLKRVEELTGKTFMPVNGGSVRDRVRATTQVKRGTGQRAASVRDWHALRSTYVTLALSAGVPMELVRRVTGHATVDVVLKHYFRPGREQFKAALLGAMPEVLTGRGQKSEVRAHEKRPEDELAGLAAKLAAGSASEAEKARLRELAAGV